MRNCHWNKKTLRDNLKKIASLIAMEKDEERRKKLLTDYVVLEDVIASYYQIDFLGIHSLLTNYEYAKDELSQTRFIWEDIKTFTDITTPIDTIPLKRVSLTDNDILLITHDFYKSIDPFFFSHFMMNYRQRHDHFKFKKYHGFGKIYGEIFTLPSIEGSFIKVYRNNTQEDALTTIHEYAHAISVLINNNHSDEEKILYSEVDSLFFEMIASDFLDEYLNTSSAPIYKADLHSENIGMSSSLKSIFELILAEENIDGGFHNHFSLIKNALGNCNLKLGELFKLLTFPEIDAIVYVTSYLIALELYTLYQVDKEKALFYLKQFILLKNLKINEYYDSILELGIIPNSSCEDYQKQCEEDILKLTRKKSKH